MTDSSLIEHLLDVLTPLGGLSVRSMFGGRGVYRHDAFFAIIHGGRAYFRTDANTRAEYVARGSRPFRPRAGRTLGTYWEVPADVLEDPDELRHWARRAADRPARAPAKVGSRAIKPMKKKKKSRARRPRKARVGP